MHVACVHVLKNSSICLMVNRLFPCVRRISQDLAKDLAILAREIHDVAGEIDSVSSSGTAPSTTVSTAATTPGSAIDTREEVGPARPTQADIQESMRKVPDFLLLLLPYWLCFHVFAFAIPPVLLGQKWPTSLLLCRGIHLLFTHLLQFQFLIFSMKGSTHFGFVALKSDFCWLDN